MKRIYDQDQITRAIATSKYKEVLENLETPLFICQYEKGEVVVAPFKENTLFQITMSDGLSMYFTCQDGSNYHLSNSKADSFLGDNELFDFENLGVFGEATKTLYCLAFSIEESKQVLLKNPTFLRILAKSLAEKMKWMAMQDGGAHSLSQRVISYIRYFCEDQTLKGIEKSADQLHCSSRQLQRILNQLEEKEIVTKIGKGTYRYKV